MLSIFSAFAFSNLYLAYCIYSNLWWYKVFAIFFSLKLPNLIGFAASALSPMCIPFFYLYRVFKKDMRNREFFLIRLWESLTWVVLYWIFFSFFKSLSYNFFIFYKSFSSFCIFTSFTCIFTRGVKCESVLADLEKEFISSFFPNEMLVTAGNMLLYLWEFKLGIKRSFFFSILKVGDYDFGCKTETLLFIV